VAKNEILLRNNSSFNADYVELFGQPIRKGKTNKTEDDGTGERARFEAALRNMGSSSYILLDPDDEVDFVEAKSGTGNQAYENFEQRLQKGISKVLLGHADALDSTPGKLGSQGKDEDGAGKALRDTEVTDCRFLEYIINSQVLPKLRHIGLPVPIGTTFRFKNDKERQAHREQEDAANLATAQVALTMKNAGLKMDAGYFEERTGIPAGEE
jgi:phage gp29-like protein